MKIWTPKQPAKKPCHANGYLQTAADARAYRDRFQRNPWAKAGSLFVPQPLRFAGYPGCTDWGGCPGPITPTACPVCADDGPIWWEVTDSSGRKFYVKDDSTDCIWSEECFFGGSFQVRTSGVDKLQASGLAGSNLTDVLPTSGGQITTCIKTHALTTGAGPWVTLTPKSSAHDLWGVITPPTSLMVTLSGFSDGAGDCTSCDNANAAFELTELGLFCDNDFRLNPAGSKCQEFNRVCTGVGAVRHVVPKLLFFRSGGTEKISARVTISYYSPTGEGCQITTTIKSTDKLFDDYSLNSSLFPFSVQIAHPFGGSAFQCTGTITATVDF